MAPGGNAKDEKKLSTVGEFSGVAVSPFAMRMGNDTQGRRNHRPSPKWAFCRETPTGVCFPICGTPPVGAVAPTGGYNREPLTGF